MKAQPVFAASLVLFCSAGNTVAFDGPRLSVTNAQGELVLSWPSSATNWVLEQAVHLQSPIPWIRQAPTLYQNAGATRSIRILPLGSQQFYRLRNLGPPLPGQTGHWLLDEGAGSVAGEGRGLAGDLFLTNTTWMIGRIGPGALRFNGAAAPAGGSRAWVSNTNYRVLPPSGQPFSFSLWFNPDAVPVGVCGILGNTVTGSGGWHVALHTPGPGTNDLVFAATGAGSSLNLTGRTLLLPGQWRQLTVTHDGIEGSLYLDSVLLARGAGVISTHDGLIYFGGGVGNYNSFLGGIDDIRAYTNALTHEQISLSGHWRFDESTGGFCADDSIQGHHAIATDPAPRTPGRNGSAIELGDSQIIIRNDDCGVLPPSGGPFSIGFWLRPEDLPGGQCGLMSCGASTNSGWRLTANVEASGESKLHLVSTNANGTLDLWTPLNLTNGVWTRVDVTYNGGLATVFVNGRKAGTRPGAIRGSREPLVIGGAPGTANFRGAIDDLKIYCRERDAAEIGPVAATMWETVLMNSTTNIVLQGSGPAGKQLSYSIAPGITPILGTLTHNAGASIAAYQAGGQRGPDVFAYTVSDGEFTSEPATVTLSVVKPHWLSPGGGALAPLDGSSPAQAWAAANPDALDAIWKTNNYYDCFFYAPGEYQTRGWKFEVRSTANPGCKHIGSGATGPNLTTLKLVDNWEAWNEGIIFSGPPSDGFEVHQMVLDCNAVNLPKHALGEPVWLRIPLATNARVDSVTLRWSNRALSFGYRPGPAAEFNLSARRSTTNTFLGSGLASTGMVDVLNVGADADELLLQLNRRQTGVDFYGLAEIEISGAAISLPTATIPGGGESRLDAQHGFLSAADGDSGSWWASGPEGQVELVLPLAPGTAINQLNLHWNCKTIAGLGRLGPAAYYLIRARDGSGLYYDVPYVSQGRTVAGLETATFATVVTDQLMVLLTDRESLVNYYSLREVSLQNGSAPVNLRQPGALNHLEWDGVRYGIVRAFDRDNGTQWASGTQGMVGAIDLIGNNLKFTQLKIIGFGAKAGRECFVMIIFANDKSGPPKRLGNVLIEDCLITEPATNNTDGVSALLLAAALPNTLTNAIVRRCAVTGLKPYFSYSHGFAAAQMEDCLVENCSKAIYFEPNKAVADNVGPILIRNSRFLNVNYGVHMNNHPDARFESITLLGNEIVLSGGGGGGFLVCDVCTPGPGASITNVAIINNIIRYADWLPRPASLEGGLAYSDMRHALFANNLVALGTANEFRVRQCPAGLIPPPDPVADCSYSDPGPPGPTTTPACLDVLLPGYQRAWFNNRNLSGALLPVRFMNFGVPGLASEQQWTE